MTRGDGKTSLILGEQDVVDLQASVSARIHGLRVIAQGQSDVETTRQRLYGLLSRLNDAARRLDRGRNGRSAAAR